jgi:hypothetical protein
VVPYWREVDEYTFSDRFGKVAVAGGLQDALKRTSTGHNERQGGHTAACGIDITIGFTLIALAPGRQAGKESSALRSCSHRARIFGAVRVRLRRVRGKRRSQEIYLS